MQPQQQLQNLQQQSQQTQNLNQPNFAPQNPIQNIPAQQLLDSILKAQMEQKIQVETMFPNQKKIMISPSVEAFNSLSNEQRILKDRIESELRTLHQLYENVILEPSDLQKLFFLKQDLEIQFKQLELLILESQQLIHPPSVPQW